MSKNDKCTREAMGEVVALLKSAHHSITVLVKFTLKAIAAHSCITWTIISQQPNNDSRKVPQSA